MDERLEAGRHHLHNGEKAHREGYLDESRAHFEAALLQFRGPELRLGEAHALRGLAKVELGCGNPALAERSARAAIAQYQEARAIVRRVDTQGLSGELLRDAEEGEGAALVLLGEILLRQGREEEARARLAEARDLFAALGGVPSAAALWLTLGRLELRGARFDAARDAFERARAIHEQTGRVDGQCHAWLALAEAHRLAGDLGAADAALDRALDLAERAQDDALVGRVYANQGALALQRSRLDEARERYAGALVRLRRSGDAEMEAFALLGAGEARSLAGDAGALERIAEGARLLGALENRHGLGTALLRAARHVLGEGRAVWALAAAECARQLWAPIDPVQGVGQALRVEVKALAALERWPAAVTAAHLRAAVAGHVQANALAVREHYRGRSPRALLDELDAAGRDGLETRTEAYVAEILEPVLAPHGLDAAALGTTGAALALVQALLATEPARTPALEQP